MHLVDKEFCFTRAMSFFYHEKGNKLCTYATFSPVLTSLGEERMIMAIGHMKCFNFSSPERIFKTNCPKCRRKELAW